MVRFQQCPKPPWHVVDPERGVAVVGRRWGAVGTAVAAAVETVWWRWEAVGTAVDPERGAAAVVVGTVGRRWEAAFCTAVAPEWEAVGTAVAPPTRWS